MMCKSTHGLYTVYINKSFTKIDYASKPSPISKKFYTLQPQLYIDKELFTGILHCTTMNHLLTDHKLPADISTNSEIIHKVIIKYEMFVRNARFFYLQVPYCSIDIKYSYNFNYNLRG